MAGGTIQAAGAPLHLPSLQLGIPGGGGFHAHWEWAQVPWSTGPSTGWARHVPVALDVPCSRGGGPLLPWGSPHALCEHLEAQPRKTQALSSQRK